MIHRNSQMRVEKDKLSLADWLAGDVLPFGGNHIHFIVAFAALYEHDYSGRLAKIITPGTILGRCVVRARLW
jgi:hypothetical protein